MNNPKLTRNASVKSTTRTNFKEPINPSLRLNPSGMPSSVSMRKSNSLMGMNKFSSVRSQNKKGGQTHTLDQINFGQEDFDQFQDADFGGYVNPGPPGRMVQGNSILPAQNNSILGKRPARKQVGASKILPKNSMNDQWGFSDVPFNQMQMGYQQPSMMSRNPSTISQRGRKKMTSLLPTSFLQPPSMGFGFSPPP